MDITDLGNLPQFLPTKAAAASAAFAGVAAALSLAVTVQITFQKPVSDRAQNQRPTVFVAPLAFVTLMVAAYGYVRLAGRPDQSEMLLNWIQLGDVKSIESLLNAPGNLFSQAHVTAALFASTGTALATGSLLVSLLVTLVVYENRSDRITRLGARTAFYSAGIAVTVVFLADGMYEIFSILRIEDVGGLPVKQGSIEKFRAVLALASALAAYCGFRIVTAAIQQRSWALAKYAVAAPFGVWLALLVTWTVFLDSSSNFDRSGRIDILYVSAWFAMFATAVGAVIALERDSYKRPAHSGD